jgi:hypothetical protein
MLVVAVCVLGLVANSASEHGSHATGSVSKGSPTKGAPANGHSVKRRSKPHPAARAVSFACGASRRSRIVLASVLLKGYTLSYCTEFSGIVLPTGWDAFSGVPAGDPAGRFVPSHVDVHHGVLTLTASRDPELGDRWGTGGVCQCGEGRTYGAYFVRSRVTGAGPDEIDLLWPVAHVWPPEIDFNESSAHADSTTWSVHFGRTNHVVRGDLRVDLERWHTWGIIWTRHAVRLTVDGRTWGVVATRPDIPTQPMTLDISQQTFCGLSAECPRRTVQMQVDWVAEFTAN